MEAREADQHSQEHPHQAPLPQLREEDSRCLGMNHPWWRSPTQVLINLVNNAVKYSPFVQLPLSSTP